MYSTYFQELSTNVFFVPSHIDWDTVDSDEQKAKIEPDNNSYPSLVDVVRIGHEVTFTAEPQAMRCGCSWVAKDVSQARYII